MPSAPGASPGGRGRTGSPSCSACACAATARCRAPPSSCSRSARRSDASRAVRGEHRNLPPQLVLRLAVMRLRLRFLLPVFALLLVVPSAAHAADKPTAKALYKDGPEGRYLLDGDWLFRLDNADQ